MIFRAGVMRILAVFLVLFAPVLAWADQGTVIAVEQPARVQSDEGLVTLALGDTVTGGDIVATGQGGSVQLLFPDETRVVVGPSSQLKVRDLLYRNNNTARRFRIDAVAGTFRLLTGTSPRRAFQVRTPTATMAVRGTEFDFAVERETRKTSLLVHDGAVRFCSIDGRCAVIPRGCQLAQLDRALRFSQPRTNEDRLEILRALFPYAQSDAALEPLFRAFIEDCNDDKDRASAPVVALYQVDLPQNTAPDRSDPPEPPTGPVNPAE